LSETDLEESGPIDYLIVEFSNDHKPDGSTLSILRQLVEDGVIRVLDLAFVRAEDDGSVKGVNIADLGFDGIDVTLFAEASSGLLDDGDFADAGNALRPGHTAAVLVYENAWAAPFATSLRRSGAQMVAYGRIPVQALLASIDALDASS
jgi:hypothetical protein